MATVNDTCEQCGSNDTTHGVCTDCIGMPAQHDLENALTAVLGAGDWTGVAESLLRELAG